MSSVTSRPMQGRSRQPGGLAFVIAVMLFGSWCVGARALIDRSMWMDEVHSWLLVTDPDWNHAFGALADGVDFNPPGWFAVTRAAMRWHGEITPAVLRCWSVFWMLLAAVGVYLLLVRRWDWSVSGAAVLIAFGHPLVVHQATEIRFYAFWCAAIVWLIHALSMPANTRGQRVAAVLCSVVATGAVTTCHYFGVLSILLVLLPVIVRRPIVPAVRWRCVAVVATTTMCLACCWPFLHGQRAALTRATWISPPTIADSCGFLLVFLPLWKGLLLCAAGVVGVMLRQRARQAGSAETPAIAVVPLSLWSAASLSLMPIVIVAVSWCLQPALVTRYAIVGLPGLAVVTGAVLNGLPRRWRASIPIVSAAWFLVSTNNTVWECQHDEVTELAFAQQLVDHAAERRILCEDRIVYARLMHSHPELASRLALIDFEDHELVSASSLRIVQRDAGRAMARWYPDYVMQSLHDVPHDGSVVLVPYEGTPTSGLRLPAGVEAHPLATGLLELRAARAVTTGGNAELSHADQSCRAPFGSVAPVISANSN